LVGGEVKQAPGALTEFFGGLPGEGFMQFIQLGQQTSVGVGVLAGKAIARAGTGLQSPVLEPRFGSRFTCIRE
jgi:hypothetical protein